MHRAAQGWRAWIQGLALELEGGMQVSALGGNLAICDEDRGVRLGRVFPVHEVC